MLGKAIEKIKSEMSKNTNPYVQVVGQFLLQHLETTPGAAEKILQEDKTIIKSLDAMKNEAKKKQVGGCAMLTDQEGFEIVLKYFGIDGKVSNKHMANVEGKAVPEVKPAAKDIDFDVSLDDFI
jgi:hypothetical protein